jgi:ammonia channel protein AmtB
LLATAITWAFAAVGTFVLLKLTDAVVGLRVTVSDEEDGLDITQHGESGYNHEEEFGGTVLDTGLPPADRSPVVAAAHA